MNIRHLVSIIIFLFVVSFYGTSQNNPTPGIYTLKLNKSLQSWGRLGGITTDQLGFIYMSNFGETVWKIYPDGNVKVLTSELYGASGNTIDNNGNLLQADFFTNSIFLINRKGDVTRYINQGLNGPVGMVVDNQGNIFVCNCRNNTISKITPNKEVSVIASGNLFACPNGISFGDTGNIYIVNFSNDDIIKINNSGEASKFVTIPDGNGNAHIAFLNNKFYVTKIKTNKLYEVELSGEYRLLAGNNLGLKDGPMNEAELARPNGITVAGKNTLLINNINGNWGTLGSYELVIRKVILE